MPLTRLRRITKEREMTYVEGFVLAVPAANKEAFRAHAEGLRRVQGIRRAAAGGMLGRRRARGKVTDF